MKILFASLLALAPGMGLTQGTTPAKAAPAPKRQTILLAAPAPAAPSESKVGPNAVPALTVPRSQYITENGRIVGGKTTISRSKK
ncbi:hypothetical protein [Hymenobacter terrenus]|uniref:hypothetical protein n=1 Tax=Hymenobacter terrenus TaxID=1629124 RepID=UPI000AC4C95C|nr:hypothetical protein [Hymenobacter terrenus]